MRARNLKPGIYKNYELARLGDTAFRLFTGLWGMADRQGRLKYEPEKIQAEIFPFRFQKVNIGALLDGLSSGEDPFIIRYEAKGKKYIQIVNFSEHQNPHPNEVASSIPPITKNFIPRLEPLPTNYITNRAGSSDVQDLQDLQDLPIPECALSRKPAPEEAPPERREYRIPEPKEDPTAAVVMYYKAVKKTIPYDDRTWDKKHWPRTAKAAVDLLQICGSYEAVRACIDQVALDMGDKSWTLETITRWAHEWKTKQGGKDYGATNSSRFFNAIAKQRTAAKSQDLRAVSEASEVLDGLRDMQGLPHKTGETDRRAPGNADDRSLAGVREKAVEAEAD